MPTPPAAPAVRVVAVTYSPGDTLDRFLDTLAKATASPVQVVLADNGSTDGAPERAVREHSVHLLRTGGNIGYGRAANLGAVGFAGDWLVIANPDVEWDPGSLDELLAAAARWPRAGAFGPAIRTADGQLYPSARAFPSLGRGIGHALLGWAWPDNPWTRSYRQESGAPVEGTCGWLSGSCFLVRREAFDAVGGFDPSYFMYAEDLDLGRRLADHGWSSVYVPSAVITHVGAHATSRDPGRMLAAHHRSLFRYLSTQYPGARWAPVRLVLALGLFTRYLLARRVKAVGEGAAPTRDATLLEG